MQYFFVRFISLLDMSALDGLNGGIVCILHPRDMAWSQVTIAGTGYIKGADSF